MELKPENWYWSKSLKAHVKFIEIFLEIKILLLVVLILINLIYLKVHLMLF